MEEGCLPNSHLTFSSCSEDINPFSTTDKVTRHKNSYRHIIQLTSYQNLLSLLMKAFRMHEKQYQNQNTCAKNHHNNQETPVRQTKQSNQLFLPMFHNTRGTANRCTEQNGNALPRCNHCYNSKNKIHKLVALTTYLTTCKLSNLTTLQLKPPVRNAHNTISSKF